MVEGRRDPKGALGLPSAFSLFFHVLFLSPSRAPFHSPGTGAFLSPGEPLTSSWPCCSTHPEPLWLLLPQGGRPPACQQFWSSRGLCAGAGGGGGGWGGVMVGWGGEVEEITFWAPWGAPCSSLTQRLLSLRLLLPSLFSCPLGWSPKATHPPTLPSQT